MVAAMLVLVLLLDGQQRERNGGGREVGGGKGHELNLARKAVLPSPSTALDRIGDEK